GRGGPRRPWSETTRGVAPVSYKSLTVRETLEMQARRWPGAQERAVSWLTDERSHMMGDPGLRPTATTVLVVEDDANVAEVLTRYLRREGYEVTCPDDGL